MIAEKIRLAKQSEEGGAQELNRYMTVYFDYSTENDIPTMLSLATRWRQHKKHPKTQPRLCVENILLYFLLPRFELMSCVQV